MEKVARDQGSEPYIEVVRPRRAKEKRGNEFAVQFSVTFAKAKGDGGDYRKRKRSGKTETPGGVAQLGEHLPCKQGVRGSIPLISTEEVRREEKRHLNRTCTTVCSSGG